ncbi:MAG: helix-turn-helix transcriptional regulator [Anaerolineales bacterium]|nr:helix-turn-helix transcriptional regulator [Anaerolineales bacterium]
MKKIKVKLRLKEILAEKNVGVRELARNTGLDVATISHIVNNHTRGIYFIVIEKICSELEISPSELFEVREVK